MDEDNVQKFTTLFTAKTDDSFDKNVNKIEKTLKNIEDKHIDIMADIDPKSTKDMNSLFKQWDKFAKAKTDNIFTKLGFGNKRTISALSKSYSTLRRDAEDTIRSLSDTTRKQSESMAFFLEKSTESSESVEVLKDKYNELTGTLDRLVSDYNALNEGMKTSPKEAAKNVQTLETRYKKLQEQLNNHQNKSWENEDIKALAENYKNKMVEQAKGAAELAKAYTESTRSFALGNTGLVGVEGDRSKQTELLDYLEDSLATLRTDLAKTQGSIGGLSTKLNKLSSDYQALGGDKTAQEEAFGIGPANELKAEIENIQSRMADLTSKKHQVQMEFDIRKDQLDAANKVFADSSTTNISSVRSTEDIGARFNQKLNAERTTLSGYHNKTDGLYSERQRALDEANLKATSEQIEQARQLYEQAQDAETSKSVLAGEIGDVKIQIQETEGALNEARKESDSWDNSIAKLNDEMNGTKTKVEELMTDLGKNPFSGNLLSKEFKNMNRQVDKASTKTGTLLSRLRQMGPVGRVVAKVIQNIYSQIATLINPLNIFKNAWSSWLDRTENSALKNTFDMIKYNLTTVLVPLLEKAANFILKIVQVLNVFTKKWFGVDLFDKTAWSAEQAAESAESMTASFDELHALDSSSDDDTSTIFDDDYTGSFQFEGLDQSTLDKIEDWAENIADVFSWIKDNWEWLVAAWAGYEIGKGLLNLLGWGSNFSGLLSGLSLGNLITGIGIAAGAALSLYSIFEDIQLAQNWNQMTPEERAEKNQSADTYGAIGGAVAGAFTGAKLASTLGLSTGTGVLAGTLIGTGIVSGITNTIQAGTDLYYGDFDTFAQDASEAGSGYGMAIGAAIGTSICPGIGTVIGAGVGWVAGKIAGSGVAGIVTWFADAGGEFSNLKISTEDLEWATEQYQTALDNENQALSDLREAEALAGESGEDLYAKVENGTLKYSDMTTEQKNLYESYKNYQSAIEDTAEALKLQTDYENAMLEAKAEESGDFSEFIDSMYDAYEKGIYSAEELQDRLSQTYADLSKDEREVFLEQLPEDMRQGVEDGAEQYYSGWQKFKSKVGKLWDGLKEAWSGLWDTIGTAASNAWQRITNLFKGNGFKTNEQVSADGTTTYTISSYDVGTNYVPNDQLAYVHQGEAIIPKKYNTGYTPTTDKGLTTVLNNLTSQMSSLQTTLNDGINVNGEFTQKGSDLYAVVQKQTNKRGNQPLSNMTYAR